ncbi:MAG: TonB family protein [Vicinamibacterales bacterium]
MDARPGSGRLVILAAAAALVALIGAAPRAQEAAGTALTSEWVLAGSPADVLAAARAELVAEGFALEKDIPASGLLVTRPHAYAAGWPDADAIGLAANRHPRSVALHVFVPPAFSPARLAVGAVVDMDVTVVPLTGKRSRGTATAYGQAPLAAEFAERIARRAGLAAQPLPDDPAARTALSTTAAAGGASTCGVPARLALGDPAATTSALNFVNPEYPPAELARFRGGEVLLQGEVTEHGTVTALRWVGGVEDANLVAAARGAASLWRFRPTIVEGCPARREVRIAMSFEIRRG